MVGYQNKNQYYFPIKNLTIKFKDGNHKWTLKNDLKYNYPHMSQVHMSTTLSLLKEPSNSFNYSFNFISISINSIKLRGFLHSTLGSLGYILTYKNKFL